MDKKDDSHDKFVIPEGVDAKLYNKNSNDNSYKITTKNPKTLIDL